MLVDLTLATRYSRDQLFDSKDQVGPLLRSTPGPPLGIATWQRGFGVCGDTSLASLGKTDLLPQKVTCHSPLLPDRENEFDPLAAPPLDPLPSPIDE